MMFRQVIRAWGKPKRYLLNARVYSGVTRVTRITTASFLVAYSQHPRQLWGAVTGAFPGLKDVSSFKDVPSLSDALDGTLEFVTRELNAVSELNKLLNGFLERNKQSLAEHGVSLEGNEISWTFGLKQLLDHQKAERRRKQLQPVSQDKEGQVAKPQDVEAWASLANVVDAVYEKDVPSFLSYLNGEQTIVAEGVPTLFNRKLPLTESDILRSNFQPSLEHPAYCLFRDRSNDALILTIRGTSSVQDCVTDLGIETVPFVGGVCHGSMLRSAQALLEELLPTIEPELAAIQRRGMATDSAVYQKWGERGAVKLVVCGHSLGAGVASIMTLLLRHPNWRASQEHSKWQQMTNTLHSLWGGKSRQGIDCHCYAYATPAVMSAQTATSCEVQASVRTLVHGDDVIPRSSERNLLRLMLDLKEKVHEWQKASFGQAKAAQREIEDNLNRMAEQFKIIPGLQPTIPPELEQMHANAHAHIRNALDKLESESLQADKLTVEGRLDRQWKQGMDQTAKEIGKKLKEVVTSTDDVLVADIAQMWYENLPNNLLPPGELFYLQRKLKQNEKVQEKKSFSDMFSTAPTEEEWFRMLKVHPQLLIGIELSDTLITDHLMGNYGKAISSAARANVH